MIPFDFEYYMPDSAIEAVDTYARLCSEGKQPLYYGGGTEIISMARTHNIYTDAVIDIKGIPECNQQIYENSKLTIGSAVTLTNIAESNFFPLLSLTVERIADHTIQDKITLGGNIAGTIIYREAVLPLLISDSDIVIDGPMGRRQVPLLDVFDKRIKLNKGELIVKLIIDGSYLKLPYLHSKRTKDEKIDYPLITLAALKKENNINIAISGVCSFPFRSRFVEQYLNDKEVPKNKRINNIISNMPDAVLDNLSGSANYRKFKLQHLLSEVLERFE